MAAWTTYKGLDIPDSTTGQAGTYLNGDLTKLADRAPNVSTSDPDGTFNTSNGYFAGSHWLNASTKVMWICLSASSSSAVWSPLYQRTSGAIILCPGSAGAGLQIEGAGNSRGTGAVDLQSTRANNSQVASGSRAFIAGGQANTASGTSSHAEGQFSIASGVYSHTEGHSNTASGYASHTEGNYNTASAPVTHAEGYYCTSSGERSHAEGSNNVASGGYSHAEGYHTQASAPAAHGEGYFCVASGNGSHAEGGSTIASAVGSHSGGYLSKAHLRAQWARASGGHSSERGTAQATITHLFILTVNATSTELTVDGYSAGAGNRFSILDGQTLSCFVNVVGRKINGTNANDNAAFLRHVCIRNEGGTTQLVGSVQVISDINPSGWAVTITTDDTNDSLQIKVTGAASTSIHWTGTVFASEAADSAI